MLDFGCFVQSCWFVLSSKEVGTVASELSAILEEGQTLIQVQLHIIGYRSTSRNFKERLDPHHSSQIHITLVEYYLPQYRYQNTFYNQSHLYIQDSALGSQNLSAC